MFCSGKRKAGRGFILIYVILIGFICIFISLGCYSMEMNIRSNNLKSYNKCLEVDAIGRQREYLLTELNKYIIENIDCEGENPKERMSFLGDVRLYFEECFIYYDKNADRFKAVYIFDGKFYKEEIYEYKFEKGKILYSCVDYSFDGECE
jgi:hypothetical protein